MIHAKLNIIPFMLSGFIALTSCSTTKGPFGQVEDDAYFSRKQSRTKEVYVPEVDVQEIIKANPPQYGTDAPQQRYRENNDNTNFNYDNYKAQQEQPQEEDVQYNNNTFLNTVPYVGQEEEAAEATRLRMQYSGNYNTYNTYNNYNDPYSNNGYGNYGYNNYGYNNYGYNNWYGPSMNIGYNSWGGWGIGMGWSIGYGYGWPHYNPYWGGAYGYNPWGYNSWYSPYYGYNCGWGCNNWYGGGYGYNNGWGYNGYAERANPRTARPRGSAGSNLPRGENMQPRGSGMTGQAPTTPNQGREMPRNPNQGQLINRDGQQIYIAPEQNRTPPRTYNTYDRSVRNGQIQRDATPAPLQPQQPRTGTPRSYGTAPSQPGGTYRGGQNQQTPRSAQPNMPQRNYNPAPAPSQPAPRSYTPAPSAPSSPGTITPPSGGGGGRGGSSGGGGGGGRSMPRR